MDRGPHSATPEPSDRVLLAAARAGDERAFGRLVVRHQAGLERYCQLMLGCPVDARHAVGEALLRGWRGVRQDCPTASARIWLYRLATQVCLEGIDRPSQDISRPPISSEPRTRLTG